MWCCEWLKDELPLSQPHSEGEKFYRCLFQKGKHKKAKSGALEATQFK